FVIGHPAFARFPLRFGRDGDGRVTEAFHGADWYTAERYTGPAAFDHPANWIAYPGHYRSHNPWFSNFRIVLRKGTLLLIHPAGQEEALVPLDDDTFRVGNTAHSPERLRFDTIVDGQALRVNLSGEYYYRALTP
ncbi:MAG: serine hydrolase, partial [Chloroflexota bacterium]|nr:serine hydrolase [Chloroflexota bacterium]